MLRIGGPREPYDLSLPYKITVTVRPLTSTGMAMAEAAARQRLESLEAQARDRREAGLPDDAGLPFLEDPAVRDGFYRGLLIQELAAAHILAWQGVIGPDGEPAEEPSRETIVAVLDVYPVAERFFQEFAVRQVMLNAAKNGSGPSPAGTSGEAEGPNTAGAAPTTGSPAPAEGSA